MQMVSKHRISAYRGHAALYTHMKPHESGLNGSRAWALANGVKKMRVVLFVEHQTMNRKCPKCIDGASKQLNPGELFLHLPSNTQTALYIQQSNQILTSLTVR